MFSRVSFAACLTALALLSALRVDAQLSKPKEDVTKLTKPTISYNSYDSSEIRLMDWDGANDRLWMSSGNVRFSGGIQWAPTGKCAAVMIFDPEDWSYAPYVIDLKTGRSRNLMELGIPEAREGYVGLSWSPGGQWLTLVDNWTAEDNSVHGYLCKVNANNGAFVRLTNKPWMNPGYSAWSPDGKKIAFSAYVELKPPRMGDSDIFVMNADGSNMVNVTNHPDWDEFPTWSPDGKKIGFRSYRDNQDLEVDRFVQRAELYIMNPDGSNVERLFNNAGWEGMVNWSPDSQWFVYRGGPIDPADPISGGVYRMHIPTRKSVIIKRMQVRNPSWVLAGESRFLSVDPAGKKKSAMGTYESGERR